MTAAGKDGWWPTLAGGLLWGLAVTLLDTLGQPLEDLSLGDLLRFTVVVCVPWSVVGLFWATAARVAERRGRAVIGYFVALPVCCTVLVLVWRLIQSAVLPRSIGAPSWLLVNVRDPDVIAYLAWENAFYGGAYLLGYVATRRGVRLRQRLAELLRARGEADVRLREARLRAYRGQLQPELMLQALATLRVLSKSDAARGHMLLDRLVDFLRAAMPAVRTGRSTLSAELTTLSAYSSLRSLIPGDGTILRVRSERGVTDQSFPPLVLLPALHAIASGLPADARLTLHAHSQCDETVLKLETSAPTALPIGIGDQLAATLRLAFGRSVSFLSGQHGSFLLEIRLSAATPSTSIDHFAGDYVPS